MVIFSPVQIVLIQRNKLIYFKIIYYFTVLS